MMLDYEDLVGLPFEDGGRGPDTYDCWGLVREMFRRQGKTVDDYNITAMDAHTIAAQMRQDENRWIRIDEPKEGCMVVFRLTPGCWANHVGICVGEGKFVHAYLTTGVCVDRLRKWRSRIIGFYEPGGGSNASDN